MPSEISVLGPCDQLMKSQSMMKEFHSISTVVAGNGGQLEKKAKENEVYAYLG